MLKLIQPLSQLLVADYVSNPLLKVITVKMKNYRFYGYKLEFFCKFT